MEGLSLKVRKETGHGKYYNQQGTELIIQLWKKDKSTLNHLTSG